MSESSNLGSLQDEQSNQYSSASAPIVDEERPPTCPSCNRRLVILATHWHRDDTGRSQRKQLWGCPRGHSTSSRIGGIFTPIELLPRPKAGGIPVLIASRKPRMLRLTAEYADSWNTAWLGQAESMRERRSDLEAACLDVGRDPKTLDITVGINVAFPELGSEREDADPSKVISGTVEEVAAGLRGYAEAGVAHLICMLDPLNEASIGKLSEAWELAKG